ncbi:MAG: PQQ-binding-like beta-propeller repeat protein [Planctomycetes bacterium]|nr:PQQ-binding-like beta-propeller repeat protein [Planctomycetota bacterium]MCB9870682.1 PQQ-binding-like beta-propeller repeat protein [Planctomycetota bacterium]
MALKGDLASVDLAQVFQMLALNQKVGLLGIQSPTAWKALYFDERGVTLYFNEHAMLDNVLAKLVRSGVLAGDGVAEAREHSVRHGQAVVDSLLAGGYLTEDDLDQALRTEIEEQIYELFFWYDAKFEFFEGATEYQGQEGIIHDRFFFGTDILIMEAARRIDEWGYIQTLVANGLEVHRHVPGNSRAFELDEEAFQIYELLDAKRNVNRLIEITSIPSFHVFKTLATLLEDGMIEAVPSDELLAAGQECMHEGRMQDAINLLERAVLDGVGVPEVHILASEAYDAVAEYEQSAFHTKCTAEYHAAQGNLREAIDLYRWVLESIPTDLAACQRVVELSVGRPDLSTPDFNPLQIGKNLVDLYLEIGEVDRVRNLLEDLLRENPTDIELKKSLINVHTKVGDTRRVIELYVSIADDLQKRGDPIQAIKYLQKILQIDRSRSDISDRIKSLYQADERKRSRRRGLVALTVVFCMLVAATIGYYIYNQTARAYYDKLDLEPLIEKKDFQGAIRVVKGFLETYPFTMVAKEAEAELVSLNARYRAYEAAREREVVQEDAKLERIRYEYKNAWSAHLAFFEQRDLTSALKSIEQVRQLVRKAGQAADRRWEVENKVDKSHRELKAYLANASALERHCRQALDEGNWQLARKNVLKLVKEFALSEQAASARVPVMFVTRPVGAAVMRSGKPLLVEKGGKQVPVVTPAVVLCPNQSTLKFELVKPGFVTREATINPLESASVSYVMTIVPLETIRFAHPVLGTPGLTDDGTLVATLRGGRIGVATPVKGAATQLTTLKLPGLSEVDGIPAVTGREIVFTTNEGDVMCFERRGGVRLWQVPARHTVELGPVVANGRAFLTDREGRLFCLSASSGRELWARPLDGRAAGRPAVFGRTVAVGSHGGTVLVLDADKGAVFKRLVLGRAVTTEVLRDNDLLVVGTEDGFVSGYRLADKTKKWTVDVGRSVRPGELCMSEDLESLFVVGSDKMLFRIGVRDGRVQVKQRLPFRLRPGLVSIGNALYVVLQEIKHQEGAKVQYQDLVLALDRESFEVLWEFRDGGEFRGLLSAAGDRLFVAGADGGIYRFR